MILALAALVGIYLSLFLLTARPLLALVCDSRSARASLARTVPAGSPVMPPTDGPAFHT